MKTFIAFLYWILFGDGLAWKSPLWWTIADVMSTFAGPDALLSVRRRMNKKAS